jgi:hypothetical protein
MVDKGDNFLVVMMDWTVLLEYIFANLKTDCWLLTGMDRLSCMRCVKYLFSVRENIQMYILVVRIILYFVNKAYFSQN